jgi:hypothetical protein
MAGGHIPHSSSSRLSALAVVAFWLAILPILAAVALAIVTFLLG